MKALHFTEHCKTPVVWVLAGCFALTLTHNVSAQDCVTCRDSSTLSDGYTSSPTPPCGSFNCLNSESEKVGFLGALHTGFFTRQQEGRLVISGVIKGTPAAEAGILPGDEIISINGSKSDGWIACGTSESQGSIGLLHLALRRENRVRQVSFPRVRTQTILEDSWLSASGSNSSLEPVALRTGRTNFHSYGDYMLGLTWKSAADQPVITDVLRGSPAYLAGILPGDKIIRLDAIRVNAETRGVLSKLSPSDYREQVSLTMLRDGAKRNVLLVAGPVSEILRRLASQPAGTLPDETKLAKQ